MSKRGVTLAGGPGRHAGFTLVEVMVTVMLVALLATIALPSYQDSIRRTQRTDAYEALATLADALEHAYINQAAPRSYTTNIASLGLSAKSKSGYYDLAVSACTGGTLADCYSITATARDDGPQSKDAKCQSLTIDSRGNRGSSPDSTSCWRK